MPLFGRLLTQHCPTRGEEWTRSADGSSMLRAAAGSEFLIVVDHQVASLAMGVIAHPLTHPYSPYLLVPIQGLSLPPFPFGRNVGKTILRPPVIKWYASGRDALCFSTPFILSPTSHMLRLTDQPEPSGSISIYHRTSMKYLTSRPDAPTGSFPVAPGPLGADSDTASYGLHRNKFSFPSHPLSAPFRLPIRCYHRYAVR